MSNTIRLAEIAHARSGDKGNHANIGVIAYTPQGYAFLGQYLTAERLAEFLQLIGDSHAERFAMPGINAYNFLLRDVLAGGASRSLRTDNQGKVLALAVLEMRIATPPGIEAMRRPASA
jgi:hypothetical protein